MTTPTNWGAEALVNTSTASDQFNPGVTALEGGGYVVVWESQGTIRAQIYDAYGVASGTELNLTTGFAFSQGSVSVAAVAGGGFAVSWSGEANSTMPDEAQITAQLSFYDASGAVVKAPADINDPGAAFNQVGTKLISLPGGGVAVAYATFEQGTMNETLSVQIFDAAGNKVGAAIDVVLDPANTINAFSLGDLGDGRFAVTWDQFTGGGRGAYMQIIDGGAKSGSVVTINNAGTDDVHTAIAGDGNGNLLAVFRDQGNQLGGETNSTLGQLLDTSGNKLSTSLSGLNNTAFGINVEASNTATYDPTIIALRGGGYMAVWIKGDTHITLVGQLFDRTGEKIDSEFFIKDVDANINSMGAPSLSLLGDGRVVVTWYDNDHSGADTAGAGIHSQIVDPRFGVVSGTDASEILVGAKGDVNESFHGAGGHDTIDAGGGNDTLFADDAHTTMIGGAGDDSYFIGGTDETLVENALEGTDTVHVLSDNYQLLDNFENLVLGNSASALHGKGSAASNQLTGNDYKNVLEGLEGNDTLDGGLGVDTLKGGAGNDLYLLGKDKDAVSDSAGSHDMIGTLSSRSLASYKGIEDMRLDGTSGISATGNNGANRLYGNTGNNKLSGAGGNDLLHGDLGADALTGGSGKDRFDFDSTAEIGKAKALRDIIRDFRHGQDKIDLKTIDAIAGGSDDAFKFIAKEGKHFSHHAGELIWDQQNHSGTAHDITLVSGDIDGDGKADFALELSGLVSLTKGDFVL